MFHKLQEVEERYQDLEAKLADPDLASNPQEFRRLSQEHSNLQEIVDEYRTFLTTYLKTNRVKHRNGREKIRKGPLAGTSSFTVTIDGDQEVHVVAGDTTRAAELCKPSPLSPHYETR